MTLLLTNDDGYDAPGLRALIEAVRGLGETVIAAPAAAMSGCGHQVTTDRGLAVQAMAERAYAVHGTPADCVRVALHRLAPDLRWVVSGINAGGNLGADVFHSGTVAAAREAVLHGRAGIAVSHYRRRGLEFDWPRAAEWVRPLLAELLSRPPEPGIFYNINLPHLEPGAAPPAVVYCDPEPGPLSLSFRAEPDGSLRYDGVYQQRARRPGSDVDVCFGGAIAVSRLRLF
jgi:5'-nucleotidase